jgi:hypothetical protein
MRVGSGSITSLYGIGSMNLSLQRAERAIREGEPSPNRLTIAQAALLNLRGQGLQQVQPLVLHPRHRHHAPTLNSDDFKVTPRPVSRYYSTHPDAFSSTAASPAYIHPQPLDLPTNFNPNMVAVLESMRAGQALSDGYSGAHAHHAHARATLATYHAPAPVHAQAQTQTRSGFTLAEERILQAHETGQQSQPSGGNSLLPSRPAFSRAAWQAPHGQTAFPSQDSPIASTDMMSEDDFHAAAQGRLHPSSYRRSQHCQIDMTSGNAIQDPSDFSSFAPSPSDVPYSHNRHDPPQQQQQQYNIPTISSGQNAKYQTPQAHTRSTTLPSLQFNQHPYRSRQHHSSISFPPSNTNNASRIRSNNYINTSDHNINHEHLNGNSNRNPRYNDDQNTNGNIHDTTHFRATLQTIHDDSENDNSPLVSPSLTYSSRTPSTSTQSPATPFFGSFAHAQENFKVHTQDSFEGMGPGSQMGKQAKVGGQ